MTGSCGFEDELLPAWGGRPRAENWHRVSQEEIEGFRFDGRWDFVIAVERPEGDVQPLPAQTRHDPERCVPVGKDGVAAAMREEGPRRLAHPRRQVDHAGGEGEHKAEARRVDE